MRLLCRERRNKDKITYININTSKKDKTRINKFRNEIAKAI